MASKPKSKQINYTTLRDESWVMEAYGVPTLEDLRIQYGLDKLNGVSTEQAARAWEILDSQDKISLEEMKRRIGLD